MTCIAAVAHKGRVYMGGDSAGIAGWDLRIRHDPKVFRNGDYLIGFTSSFRMGQILRYSTDLPHPGDSDDLHRFMCTRFVDAIRAVFQSCGFAKKESEQESAGVFLVGIRGRLFQVSSDYQVGENVDQYDAIGCGDTIALGALFATPGRRPAERIKIALQAAQHLSAGVREPFLIEWV